MNFKQSSNIVRTLLFPFALIYGLIIIIRNFLYNKKLLRTARFNLPIICVGNLSVGGTGKSPMVEYLVGLLNQHYIVATLSRGYKRKTKGYALAEENTTAIEIGDEPMQFHVKYPEMPVAVGEERIVAVAQLLHDRPDTQTIILDDAFQHRPIEAGLNILLTECNHLYTKDFFLPAGSLRDQKASAERAHIIVVTKCADDLSVSDKETTIKELNISAHQKIFFTCIEYGFPYHITQKNIRPFSVDDDVLMVCGIANPLPLKNYIEQYAGKYDELLFSDHHIFSTNDMKDIQKKLDGNENKIIITTEKDAVRLLKFSNELTDLPVYVLPVKHKFLFNEGADFNRQVIHFIDNFSN